MTRVLIIEAAGEMWGSERALLELIGAVNGVEVAVCCPPDRPLAAELRRRGVRVLPYFIAGLHNKPRWRRAQAALGVLRAAFEFRPSVIHLNQGGGYNTALPAARLLGIPLTAHIRLLDEAAYLAARRPDPARLRALIAISGAVETELARHTELGALKVHRIYDPCARRFTDDEPTADAARIVCAGRLEPMKGQALLLDALALLKTDGIEAECLMAGSGEAAYAARLRQASVDLGLGGVQWLGFVDDIGPMLRSASILAFPSERETLGRVILEGWDAGAVPVVYAGSGGAAEIVRAADAGLLYQEQTPRALAGALREALRLSPAQRARLVENGRGWMARNCSPTVCAEAFTAVLKSAANR